MVEYTCILMPRISFDGLKFAFECFEFGSNVSNLHSNALNPFRMIRIWIRMVRIPFEWLEFGFECFELAFEYFECLSNGQKLHLNASNHF